MTDKKEKYLCNACGEGENEVKVAYSDELLICEDCLDAGKKFLSEQNQLKLEETKVKAEKFGMEKVVEEVAKLPKPAELVEKLDEYVIGQTVAKRMLSVAIYQHQKRVILNNYGFGSGAKKSNLLLIGPTGTGKTLLAQTIALLTDLPIHIEDATTLTEAGYVGDSVEDMIQSLVDKCGGDIALAESKGIVFIDEIDKLRKRGDSANLNRDPAGEGVQSALLKLTEGTEVRISATGAKKQSGGRTDIVNTSNILFIASGAFAGIEELVKGEGQSGTKAGFIIDKEATEKEKNKPKVVLAKHVIDYGMKPEFVGRFNTIVNLEPLSMDVMKSIITDSKKSMFASHQLLAKADGISLTISNEAIEAIANDAFEKNIGARGLDGTINKVLSDFSFESPSLQCKEFEITKELVEEKLKSE
ncbi:ATP-dependent Clp protease ATP-binding subunit ClpX [Vibrio vulnificus]|nr:ATP-dependent Clp protease ATP-binding subunit ClpX [Vibrio vulnificus]